MVGKLTKGGGVTHCQLLAKVVFSFLPSFFMRGKSQSSFCALSFSLSSLKSTRTSAAAAVGSILRYATTFLCSRSQRQMVDDRWWWPVIRFRLFIYYTMMKVTWEKSSSSSRQYTTARASFNLALSLFKVIKMIIINRSSPIHQRPMSHRTLLTFRHTFPINQCCTERVRCCCSITISFKNKNTKQWE